VDEYVETQWTAPARERLGAAADALRVAITAHVAAVSVLTGDRIETEALFAANAALGAAVQTYNDANFDWSGTGIPVTALDDDDDEPESLASADTLRLGVEARFDFVVRDEERFVAFVRDRLLDDEAKSDAHELDDHFGDASACLAELFMSEAWDTSAYQDHGLEPAGHGYNVAEISKTPFEMTFDERDESGF
jgi:hypothetical protein